MGALEEIQYKPIPVRTLLVEMKDLSELMIDLAYSSALFHNTDLARDVLELEKKVDNLALLLKMNVMIAARDAKDAKDLLGVSLVSSAADEISDAAADIAYIVLHGIGIHPAVREAFKRVEEQLGRFIVKRDSILSGKSLRELRLASRIGVDIIAIRRGNEWIINPKGGDRILEGDILIVRGTSLGIEELGRLAEGNLRKLED